MQTIELRTTIRAPRARCFDLARSVELHLASTSETRERAVAGVTQGLLGLHQEVTWEAVHFGVKQRFTSKITAFSPPAHFQDAMTRGAFAQFVHDHDFAERGGDTVMTDRVAFAAPLGVLGRLVDRFVLRAYLERFLRVRNELVKRVAESDEWRRFLEGKA